MTSSAAPAKKTTDLSIIKLKQNYSEYLSVASRIAADYVVTGVCMSVCLSVINFYKQHNL